MQHAKDPTRKSKDTITKVYECVHVSEVFERANEFDIIHNHFDYLPLTYSSFVNTPVVNSKPGKIR